MGVTQPQPLPSRQLANTPSLADASAIVFGATGPVGLRAAELLALENSRVTLVSRTLDRAEAASVKRFGPKSPQRG
ncbi:MAG: hypothetical protein U0936_11495 [Planctomycetaceae bacterium]